MMDAMDQYIARLQEPAIQDFWLKFHRDRWDDDKWNMAPVSGEDLVAKEAELGFSLPPSYRKLVTMTRPEHGLWGVLWLHQLATFEHLIDSHPPFLLAVYPHDNGDCDCFDTRCPDERGEYPIVRFDHEVHDHNSTEFEVISVDLGEYLLGSETPF